MKILYNRKETALVQYADGNQASLGKSNYIELLTDHTLSS